MAYLQIYDQRHSRSLLLLFFLSLLCYTGGKCVVVITHVGDDAVLPCEVNATLNPTIDRTEMAIEWSRQDLPPDQYVYFQRDGKEHNHSKIPSYIGRTSLFMDEVKKGNLSLKLSRVNSSDEANYTCFLSEMSEQLTVVHLIVGVHGSSQGVHVSDSDSTDIYYEVPTDKGLPVWGGLIILGVILVLLGVLGYWKRHDIQEFVHSRLCTPETPAGDEDRSMDDVSELSPMNGGSVDKPV